MEWNGMDGRGPSSPSLSLPLFSLGSAQRGRPPCRAALPLAPPPPPRISLERGHGADGRRTRTTEARRTEGGTKVGVEEGASLSLSLPPKKATEERRGEGKANQQSFSSFLPDSTLFSSPLLYSPYFPTSCPALPSSPLRRLLRLAPPFCQLTISFTPPSTE